MALFTSQTEYDVAFSATISRIQNRSIIIALMHVPLLCPSKGQGKALAFSYQFNTI